MFFDRKSTWVTVFPMIVLLKNVWARSKQSKVRFGGRVKVLFNTLGKFKAKYIEMFIIKIVVRDNTWRSLYIWLGVRFHICQSGHGNRNNSECELLSGKLLSAVTQAAAVISTVIVGDHQRALITLPARFWHCQQVLPLPATLAPTWLWKPSDIQKGTDLHWQHHWINSTDYQLTYRFFVSERKKYIFHTERPLSIPADYKHTIVIDLPGPRRMCYYMFVRDGWCYSWALYYEAVTCTSSIK